MTIDPREVAAEEVDEVADAISCALPEWVSILQGWGSLEQRESALRHVARAAIAADHQWLAEHVPAAVKQAVDELKQAAIRCEVGADGYDKVVDAETELLALYQRPVIDEAAVERACREWERQLRDVDVKTDISIGSDVAFENAMRAALEAFVAGGEG